MRTLTRASWLLLAIFVVGGSLALTASSEEIRAGEVQSLEGTASIARASLTQPRALQHRDSIYLHDQITTGDASRARILLGNRALLTVRERSLVQITEVPGTATVSEIGRAHV